jgi:hypothetical protein
MVWVGHVLVLSWLGWSVCPGIRQGWASSARGCTSLRLVWPWAWLVKGGLGHGLGWTRAELAMVWATHGLVWPWAVLAIGSAALSMVSAGYGLCKIWAGYLLSCS